MIERRQMILWISSQFRPLFTTQIHSPLPERLTLALLINLVFNGPGKGPVVGIAPFFSKKAKDNQWQPVIGIRQHGMKIPTNRRCRQP